MTEPNDDRARFEVMQAAFDRGDYRTVRAIGRALASSPGDSDVREAAASLLARTTPDPAAKWLFLTAFALIVAVTVYWLTHPPR